MDLLLDARCRRAITHALAGHDGASDFAKEAALMLLLKLANARGAGEDTANVGSDAWKREFALEAVPLVAACALGNNPEPVRAQAAQAAVDLYVTDGSRHLVCFGADERTEATTSDSEYANDTYLEVIYGRDSDECAAHRAEVARLPAKAKRRGGLLQVDTVDVAKVEEETRTKERKHRKYAGPPSGKLLIYDEEECDALQNAPMKKGVAGRLVSQLENVSQPRKVAFDGAKFVWETRDKASGHVAVRAALDRRLGTSRPNFGTLGHVDVDAAHFWMILLELSTRGRSAWIEPF